MRSIGNSKMTTTNYDALQNVWSEILTLKTENKERGYRNEYNNGAISIRFFG